MLESLAVPSASSNQFVLDSWPILEWLKRREPVASRLHQLFVEAREGRATLWLSTINQGEVYYNCWYEWNQERAEAVLAGISRLPIHVVHPTEEDVRAAARLKAECKVAYADAFTAVLAIECTCPVVTGDPDFLKMERESFISVEWWGK